MSAITPDLSDDSRCVSVHWSLPVQCVLPRTHRANWHEAWHPKSGNRMRYRHPGGSTEQLLNGAWVSLEIPPPGGYCNEQNPSNPKAFCDDRAGHSWMHRVVYDGCTYTWGATSPRPAGVEQLTEDVRTLRARVAELETAAGLVAEYRVPTTDGRWLSVRREPQGDGWAVIASHREDQWRRAYAAGRWQTIPVIGPVGLFEYATAEDALRVATVLAAELTGADATDGGAS